MEFIKFEDLLNIKDIGELDDLLCDKMVVGGKVMCFMNKDRSIIIKEMRKSFNEGRDCMVLDEVKDIFGVNKIGMYRVKSDKSVIRIDNKNKLWKDNMKYIEGEYIYLVMNRFDNIGSLSNNKEYWKDKNVRLEYLKILLYRSIFRVSDSNKTNVLINNKGVLMSIDENNIGKRDCILSKKYKFSFKDYKMKDYDIVLDDLMNNMDNKIDIIKNIMIKYDFNTNMIDNVIYNYKNLKIDVYNDIDKYNKEKDNKKKDKKKKEDKVEELGEMRKIGVFNSISYNGYKVDIMKSCIQKYLRRGEFNKGIYCLWELDLFKGYIYEVNGKEYSGKGIRSNMRNRLLIMLGEDVDIDWKLWIKMGDWFNKWEEYRDNDDNIDRVYLMNIYKVLCDSKKSRMCSFIRASYGNDNMNIKNKYSKFYSNIDEYIDNEEGKLYYKKDDSDEFKRYISGFMGMLNKKDDRVFYWFFKIWNYKGKIGKRGRRMKTRFVLLDIIKKCIDINNINLMKLYNIIEKWVINNNNSRDECWLWIMGLVRIYMNKDNIDWNENIDYELDMNMNDVNRLIKKNLDREKIEIDKYCIDMHCSEGRGKGMNGEDFWKEGGVVYNEGKVNELYKNIYRDIKMKNY